MQKKLFQTLLLAAMLSTGQNCYGVPNEDTTITIEFVNKDNFDLEAKAFLLGPPPGFEQYGETDRVSVKKNGGSTTAELKVKSGPWREKEDVRLITTWLDAHGSRAHPNQVGAAYTEVQLNKLPNNCKAVIDGTEPNLLSASVSCAE